MVGGWEGGNRVGSCVGVGDVGCLGLGRELEEGI